MGDDVGDAEGLARARYPEQGLVRQTGFDAFDHLANGFGLIARRLKAGNKLEIGHEGPLVCVCKAAGKNRIRVNMEALSYCFKAKL
jgi:hypothetical protein